MIDLSFLERLLDLLNRSDAQTIEIRKWTTTVRVSRNAGFGHPSGPVTYHVAAPSAPAAPAPPASGGAAGSARGGGGSAGGGTAAPPSAGLTEIKSPMVGTFYAQPEPGADPYVQVGNRVKPGDTLCIIEAMKIMNPLDSEVSGVVKEIAVEDGQPVEFGQVLFRVDPHG